MNIKIGRANRVTCNMCDTTEVSLFPCWKKKLLIWCEDVTIPHLTIGCLVVQCWFGTKTSVLRFFVFICMHICFLAGSSRRKFVVNFENHWVTTDKKNNTIHKPKLSLVLDSQNLVRNCNLYLEDNIYQHNISKFHVIADSGRIMEILLQDFPKSRAIYRKMGKVKA